ncbi:aminotransferase class V-fold PLP-dependent enzyme [Idiomarina seosinensis]|uniref:aminotransferase class V-fold PLP-dependent enzyme n=1 Tax=Idiomarina seosinensis TaxID=281739 RepID=UPI00384AA75A
MKPVELQPDSQEVYLDCNATTPVLPQIAHAVSHTMEAIFGNPSSSHVTGLKARYILDTTRQLARQAIGSYNSKLIFTSGATEGIQTAVLSALRAAVVDRTCPRQYLLYGATEHKAVPQALAHWNQLLGLGAELKAIPVDRQGLLDQQFIARYVGQAAMICTMAVNNETGVSQDLAALEQVIREHAPTIPWMVDCVQVLGKKALNLDATSIDYAPFSGHKLYGPKGIGFMAVRDKAPFTPLIIGGGQESGYRSGTENLPGIAALSALFQLLQEPEGVLAGAEQLSAYRDQLAEALQQAFPSVVFNNDFSVSVPTTVNFSVQGVASRDIMDVLDACHIRVSSGSACSSKVTRSFVLDAMGLEDWRSESAIRMSFGPATTRQHIDLACERLQQAAKALQQSCLIVADTNDDNDRLLDGVVQLRYDDHCCYLIIDQQAGQMLVVDPHAALAGRIENIVRCQHYQVPAVLTTQPEGPIADAAALLRDMLPATEGPCDPLGWPQSAVAGCDATPLECSAAVQGCLTLGSRRVFRLGSRLPVYLLSEPVAAQQPLPVDFAFIGSEIGVTDLSECVAEHTLLCPGSDPDNSIVSSLNQSVVQSGDTAIDIAIGDNEQYWQSKDVVIIDVREHQEHVVDDLPGSAEVINVPLTQLIQFIHDNPSLKQRELICVCRSGNRSGVVADALRRHGFTKTRHLLGGLALAST